MKEKYLQKLTRDLIHLCAFFLLFWGRIFSRRRKLKIVNCQLKILLIQSHHFGDLILALPAIRLCRQKYPKARITLLLGSWQKPLTNLIEGVDEIIYFDFPWTDRSKKKKESFFSTLNFIKKLRQRNFDLAINFSPDFYVNLMIWRAKIPERVGLENAGKRFLTKPLPDREDCHQSENLMRLSEAFTEARPASRASLSSERASARARQERSDRVGVAGLLKRSKSRVKKELVAIQLASGAPARNWPLEYSEKLVDILEKKGYDLAVIDASDPKHPKLPKHPDVSYSRGKIPLEKLPKFLADCRVFIGPNSGPGHLAALVGTPVISIFSAANNPEKWQPKGKNVTILTKNVPCKNCGFHICSKNNYCLRLIKPEEVVKCLEKIYPL